MRTIVNRVPVAASIGLAVGLALGFVVATATGRNLHMYLRFVGLLVIVALVIVGKWVYQTYVRPKGAHVEETEVDSAS